MLGRLLLFLGLAGISIAATGVCTELVVQRVEFNLVEQAGARDPWFEIAVTVNVERGDAESANPRFTREIAVMLDLATETEARGTARYEFYAATAEYPTLEVGRCVIRYYLPPEIVKRDRLRGEPFAWQVFVFEEDEELAALTSNSLGTGGALASYRSRLAREAGRSEGILRLQSETPFRDFNARDTPNVKLRISVD